MLIRPLLPILVLFFSAIPLLPAQHTVQVDTNVAVVDLIRNEFLKGGIEIRDIRYSGDPRGLGLFTCRSDSFPMAEGIILSTGNAALIEGPNHQLGLSEILYRPGDPMLDSISRGITRDASIIEFDFIPSSENIAFDFLFGSEEYPEYVNSDFNDVFAFLITSKDRQEKYNIAYLPRTHEPITVNNVNHLKNTEYFINNPAPNILYLMEKEGDMSYNSGTKSKKKSSEINAYNRSQIKCRTVMCNLIQYDGFTKVITTKAKVKPDSIYHFKIAIADVHDAIYDSGVILRSHSFKSYDRYGKIKGDTTGYVVQDEDLKKEFAEEKKVIKKISEKVHRSETVLFDFDSAVLTDSAEAILKKVLGEAAIHPGMKIQIQGHTDGKGSNEYNDALSVRRAEAVQKRLRALGINASQIALDHQGETKPVSDNENAQGRSRNRRVEIHYEY